MEYSAKANFKVLGRKLGRDMKAAAARIAELTPEEIQSILSGATLSVDFPGNDATILEITAESVEIQRSEKAGLKVLNEGSLTVALDTEITPGITRRRFGSRSGSCGTKPSKGQWSGCE